MGNKLKTAIALAICVIVLTLLGVVLYYSNRTTLNPEGTVGNTAGNLNNAGLFCEYDGTVYFSNSFDGGSLFAMTPEEGEIHKLNSLQVRNILAGGRYLYYFQTGSATSGPSFGQTLGIHTFTRSDLNGSNSVSLCRDTVVTGQLVDNYLYLMTSVNSGLSFYKLKIDNTDKVVLAENYIINPACAADGVIYYNNTQDNHYLFGLDTRTDVSSEIWRGNLWYPVLEGDFVYYLDVANNYRLCRYSLSQDVIYVLTHDRVDCFNVGGGYIYYQKNGSEPQLKCMRTDGSGVMVIAEGNYTHINMTSQYVYFQLFGDNTTLYHSRLGSGSYEVFSAAAALQK